MVSTELLLRLKCLQLRKVPKHSYKKLQCPSPFLNKKGNRTTADLRYGEKDIISPSTLIFAPIKG